MQQLNTVENAEKSMPGSKFSSNEKIIHKKIVESGESSISLAIKIVAIFFSLILYTYMVLFLKTAYLRDNKLEEIGKRVARLEVDVAAVRAADAGLVRRIRDVSSGLEPSTLYYI